MKPFGPTPWLPQALASLPSWRDPIPAERLAAWRIATGLVVLFTLFALELPAYEALYGPDAWVPPLTVEGATVLQLPRVALGSLPAWLLFGAAGAGAVAMVLGRGAQLGAGIALIATAALQARYPYTFYGSDQIELAMLFYMALAPTGATWVVGRRDPEARSVHPWPVQLAFVHMTTCYFVTGLSKLLGPDWVDGSATIYIFANPSWARFPAAGALIPEPLHAVGTWGVLAWELLFPILVLRPRTRLLALGCGVAFHVATVIFVRVGGFSSFMLLFYVPLLPWERLPQLLGARAQNR